jgi:plastocyanin
MIGPINNGPAGFLPGSITVDVGDMIVWQNTDTVIHSAAATDGSFQTDVIQPSASSLPITFTTAGTFPYQCTQHPAETGTVTVNSP